MELYELTKHALVMADDCYALVLEVYPWGVVQVEIDDEKFLYPVEELNPVELDFDMIHDLGFKKNRRLRAYVLEIGALDVRVYNMAGNPQRDLPEFEVEVAMAIGVGNGDGNGKGPVRMPIECHHELMKVLDNCRNYRYGDPLSQLLEE